MKQNKNMMGQPGKKHVETLILSVSTLKNIRNDSKINR